VGGESAGRQSVVGAGELISLCLDEGASEGAGEGGKRQSKELRLIIGRDLSSIATNDNCARYANQRARERESGRERMSRLSNQEQLKKVMRATLTNLKVFHTTKGEHA
jgi:hypothetical protein